MSCVNREQLRKDLLLYAVTDRSWLGNETLYEQVEKALKGGATFIQLREKELDEEHFMEEAVALKELCHKYHVPFVINDNVKIAKEMDAGGVHVGQNDMEADDVRKILGEDKILGVSAQTVEQAVLAEKMGADYLGVGAVFSTSTKKDAADVSKETLQAICEVVNIPVIAIGGIGIAMDYWATVVRVGVTSKYLLFISPFSMSRVGNLSTTAFNRVNPTFSYACLFLAGMILVPLAVMNLQIRL